MFGFVVALPFLSGTVRKHIAAISMTLGAAIFWSFIIAAGIKKAFDLSEDQAFFYFLIPCAVLIALLLYPKMAKLNAKS